MTTDIDYVQLLTTYIRDVLRIDQTNHYTALAPRRLDDGMQTMNVKDDRHSKILRIVIVEGE